MMTPEQLLASQKAAADNLYTLTAKAFEGVEKLIDLNMSAAKAALKETAVHSKAVLGVKDAQELVALQAGLLQPMAEKSAAYSRHVYEILGTVGAEFGKVFEEKTADAQKTVASLVDNVARNAPAGSETAVAVLKSTMAAANNAFESVQKVVKQATEVAEANFNAVATTAVNATKQVATSTKKR